MQTPKEILLYYPKKEREKKKEKSSTTAQTKLEEDRHSTLVAFLNKVWVLTGGLSFISIYLLRYFITETERKSPSAITVQKWWAQSQPM